MKRPLRPTRAYAVLAGAAALGALWLAFGYEDKSRPSGERPSLAVPVTIAPVERRTVPLVRWGLGAAEAWNKADITPQVSGQIVSIAFVEGALVNTGAVLARIDDSSYRAALDQAVARKAANEAELASAQRDLARYKTVVSEGFETQQLLDRQVGSVEQLTATVQANAAAIATAQINLDRTTITAPFSGYVGLRRIDVGNVVDATPAAVIATITQVDPIAVVFSLPQRDLPAVQRAFGEGRMQATAYDENGRTILGRGVVRVIDNTVDPATGTFRVKAEFANPARALWPGQMCQVEVEIGTASDAIVVPDAAVQRGPAGLYAWIVSGDKAAMRTLVTGASQNGATIVTQGLTGGESVVVAGAYRLTEGARVAVRPASASLSAVPVAAP